MASLETFRREARAWIAENYPLELRGPTGAMDSAHTPWGGKKTKYATPAIRTWMDRMAAKGWSTPEWPTEYGGAGLSAEESQVLREELAAAECRPAVFSFGLMMLSPVLLAFGSEEQKREHLPKIARGEIRWCQGYSEPGAGSDLASLRTRAEDKGDHWLVNGEKIWTSYADQSDWIFCLVRTSTETKQGGISFLLIDMESEGVSTRPIPLISGSSEFCQTFFENVRVPKENMVGAPGQGWTIAKKLLEHERTGIASGVQSGLGGTPSGEPLAHVAKRFHGETDGRVANSSMREAVARQEMNAEALSLTIKRIAEETERQGISAAASVVKILGSRQNQAKFELLLDLMGQSALGWEGDAFEDDALAVTRAWLRSKANSIEGGTSEIQRNIVAKRVLGLPD